MAAKTEFGSARAGFLIPFDQSRNLPIFWERHDISGFLTPLLMPSFFIFASSVVVFSPRTLATCPSRGFRLAQCCLHPCVWQPQISQSQLRKTCDRLWRSGLHPLQDSKTRVQECLASQVVVIVNLALVPQWCCFVDPMTVSSESWGVIPVGLSLLPNPPI